MKAPTFGALRRQVHREESACWLCQGRDLRAGEAWTIDHVIPRALSGSDTRENLRRAHSSCNSRRGTRMVTDELRRELQRKRRKT